MRILWFSDTAMPAVRRRLGLTDQGNRAGWVANAATALSARKEIELGIAWSSPLLQQHLQFTEGALTYYCIPRGGWMEAVGHRLRGTPLRHAWQLLTYVPRYSIRQPLQDCMRVVEEFQPDLIHIHGTESFYGLLGARTEKPVVVSLQGILTEYAKVYWGSILWWQRPLFPRELLLHTKMRSNARREARIIRQNQYFTGRTHWDRETLLRINPGAQYFSDGARLLRPEFYGPAWSLEKISRHCLYTTVTARPYKGTDTLIKALGLIRQKYPSAHLRIGGYIPETGFGRYLRNLISKSGLEDHIELLGFVEAEDIVRELKSTHVYVLGSHIENSPNSVAEAQTVGTPCVATTHGGTPSMVSDGISGMLYPAGDATALVNCLDRIFSNDSLAISLSEGERELARLRGNDSTNTNTLIEIYRQVLNKRQA